MSVGLGGGSSTWALARELRGVDDLTIVTNSLPVADVFARPDRADEPYTQTVVLTGGVRTPADALVGPVAVASLEHLHCDVVFLGVRGIDLTAGLTTSNLLEAETNRALVAAGARAVVLADHTKWGAVGLTTIVDLNEVDLVVMDEGLDPKPKRPCAHTSPSSGSPPATTTEHRPPPCGLRAAERMLTAPCSRGRPPRHRRRCAAPARRRRAAPTSVVRAR